MGNSVFKFKQFDVDQSGCAMKINTDGVLLGALADRQKEPLKVLDIGTGTGVIALMLAQRFKQARVDGVEIDASAAACAARNAQGSAFTDRTRIFHVAILDFNEVQFPDTGQYDLIVSNPPYFVNDLKSTDGRKGLARHTDDYFFKQLLERVSALLSKEGYFWFILPIKQAENLVKQAAAYGLVPLRRIFLHSDETKAAFRHIVCLGYGDGAMQEDHLYIYQQRGVYTDSYKRLLKDFFLAF